MQLQARGLDEVAVLFLSAVCCYYARREFLFSCKMIARNLSTRSANLLRLVCVLWVVYVMYAAVR